MPPHHTLTATHWGTYRVQTLDQRITAIEPFARDRDPSPIGRSLADTVDDRLRIRQPMVREGYLRHGPRRADGSELPVAMTLRRIVYAHEGQIRVDSEAGNGASFEIILPRYQAPLPVPASVAACD